MVRFAVEDRASACGLLVHCYCAIVWITEMFRRLILFVSSVSVKYRQSIYHRDASRGVKFVK